MKNSIRFVALGLLGVSLLAYSGCKPEKEDPKSDSQLVNEWIYDNMDFWYFWTDIMVARPQTNQDPAAFYNQLLVPQDRFSFIYDDYEELLNLLRGVSLESGFEFKLYLEAPGSSNVIMQIVYVKKGAVAENLGLRRGDVIFRINGTTLTTGNYQGLLAQLNEPWEATYRRFNFETEEFEDQSAVTITPNTFAENPFLLDTVYEIEGKKIGYMIYTFFSPGPSQGNNQYDEQMDELFGGFQGAGVTDFILDLRFNSGGSETSIRNLASLMVRGANPGDLIFKKQYNAQVEDEILADDDLGEAFLNVNYMAKSANIGSQLGSGRVHVITSDRSASASEVVINALKPYMEVFIVGDTTVGKDAGSITLYEDDNPRNRWALQPIVVKLVNRNGEDYPEGFYPDVPLKDNFLVLLPLGDVFEPLLYTTLVSILDGEPSRAAAIRPDLGTPLYESTEHHAWSNRVLMER